MTWWSEHSAVPRFVLAELAIRCRFVDRFVGSRVPSHVSGQRFSAQWRPPSLDRVPASPVPRLHRYYEGATTSRPREPGPLWFRFQAPRAPPVFVFAAALLTSPEEARQAWNTWSAGVPYPACRTRGRVRDLTGFLAIRPMPLPCSKTPAEPARSRLGDLADAAPGQPKPKASAGT
jgi:hypothetical protein